VNFAPGNPEVEARGPEPNVPGRPPMPPRILRCIKNFAHSGTRALPSVTDSDSARLRPPSSVKWEKGEFRPIADSIGRVAPSLGFRTAFADRVLPPAPISPGLTRGCPGGP